MVTLGQNHPARSPRGEPPGQEELGSGRRTTWGAQRAPQNHPECCPLPSQACGGHQQASLRLGLSAQQLCLPSADTAPFCGTPAQSQSWSPTEEAARTLRSAPSSRVGHTPGDDAITHSAPASSILPEASRAPYHHDESGPPRAPLPKTCY